MKKLLKTILLLSLCFLIFTGAGCYDKTVSEIQEIVQTFKTETYGYKLISSERNINFKEDKYFSSHYGIVEYNGESYSWLTISSCVYTKKGTKKIVLDAFYNVITGDCKTIEMSKMAEQSAVMKFLCEDKYISPKIAGVLEFDGRLFIYITATKAVPTLLGSFDVYFPPMIFEYDIVNGTVKFADYYKDFDYESDILFNTCIIRTN